MGAQYWPFVVLIISVATIIGAITLLRMHAFVALILAALVAGLIATPGSLPALADGKKKSHGLQAVELTMQEFGKTCGQIGVVIGLASIIGMALLESGAADRVVRKFLDIFGEKRAGLALLVATYIVSIPIFFDTIFMLLVPLAQALRRRTGKDYLLYMMAICCAGVTTHCMVIPHPGPLQMASALSLDAGLTIVVGLLVGIVPVAVGWLVCVQINRRMVIALPAGASGLMPADPHVRGTEVEASAEPLSVTTESHAREVLDYGEGKSRIPAPSPSFALSLAPVLLPVALIGFASFLGLPNLRAKFGSAMPWIEFIGDRNIALLIGALIAVAILWKMRNLSLQKLADLIGPPLETAGVIILITAAGGAFGAMLRNAGVGTAIADFTKRSAEGGFQLNLIAISYLVAVIIRIAQGSATVAMLTTAAIMYPLTVDAAGASVLPYHRVYLFLAIGFGAQGISWMNDSGFWVVSRLGGMTEKETLKSWTVLLGVISGTGFVTTFILSKILPFAQ